MKEATWKEGPILGANVPSSDLKTALSQWEDNVRTSYKKMGLKWEINKLAQAHRVGLGMSTGRSRHG